jgi:heme exporter protein D
MMATLFGKYAAFIVPAYGLTVLVVGYLIVSSLLHARRWRRRAEAETER